MITHETSKLGFLGVLALMMTACQTGMAHGQNRLIQPHQETAMSTAQPKLNTVNIVDKSLQVTHQMKSGDSHTYGKLVVDNLGVRSTKTRMPEVWVQLRNLTDYPQNILVRTTWYDSSEMPVDGPSSWKTVFFAPNSGEVYKSKSINLDAENFYIEIREVPK